jgi:hypothetical protein
MQYLDKNGINYASVYGLQDGTNLHGQDYNWLGSIFYFGMLKHVPSCRIPQLTEQVIYGHNILPAMSCNDSGLGKLLESLLSRGASS